MQGIANHFSKIAAVVPYFLNAVSLTHRVVGPKPLEYISSKLNVWSDKYIPEWNPYMPSVSVPPSHVIGNLKHVLVPDASNDDGSGPCPFGCSCMHDAL